MDKWKGGWKIGRGGNIGLPRSLRRHMWDNSQILILTCHPTDTSGKRESTPISGKHDTSRIQIPLVEDVWARTESQFSEINCQS